MKTYIYAVFAAVQAYTLLREKHSVRPCMCIVKDVTDEYVSSLSCVNILYLHV